MTETRGLWRGKTLPKSNAEAFNNVWVKGNLIHFGEHYYIHPLANAVKVQNELGRLVVMHEVDPSTLGECTGFRDDNGKPIFEGDIVEAYKFGSDKFVDCITFREGCFWYGNWNFVEFLCKFCDYELVGNMYDNPELLKQGAHNENI